MKTYLLTGGCGFIGSCLVRQLLTSGDIRIINLDKLTYAGHPENVPEPPVDRYTHVLGCIGDAELVEGLLAEHRPDAILHLAAESHVDRSIDGPAEFVRTNVFGTVNLLEAALRHYRQLPPEAGFRFLHVSTDEVYGSLGPEGAFTETSPYQPNSPYAASKASSDLFVRAYGETYGLPVTITNCSNNYGPYQYPEKLIPLMILNAIEGKPLPVYGDGLNVRDWLHVEDHCEAIRMVLERGQVGATYNIGGRAERNNLEVVHAIGDLVDHLLERPIGTGRALVQFVTDRPGHDRRFAIDASKFEGELGWRPTHTFESGLRETVEWYLDARPWISAVTDQSSGRKRLGTRA